MTAYRPDIDGLRAICIAVVVMFHAGFGDWTGGYIGVDVFFVISGYLITSLIAREIADGRFRLLGFYERRVRRLLSATIPVLLATTLFAWAFYPTGTFEAYAKSLVAFATYTSNWFFLNSTGYFGVAAEETPLLHTWSLAVEEQFYLVFPALLILLARVKISPRLVVAFLAVASLAYSETELRLGHSERAFFSSVSRFWELMAGAFLALYPIRQPERTIAAAMRVAGLAMILVPVFVYGSSTPFPGLAAVVPVAGALLIIAAGAAASDPVAKVLSSPPMVYLGRISYSLYLWHWPVLAAMSLLAFKHNDLHATIAILISIALASLSYHYVEQPVRTRRVFPRGRDIAAFLTGTTAAVVMVGTAGWATGGWPGRFGPDAERIASEAAIHPADPDRCFDSGAGGMSSPNTFCKIGADGKDGIDLLLWGDSHAGSLIPVLRKYADERDLSFAVAARGDCVPVFGIWRSKDVVNRVCLRFNDEVKAFIEKNDVKAIAIAARWSVYTGGAQWLLDEAHPHSDRTLTRKVFEDGLDRTLSELEPRAVAVIEQVPQNLAAVPSAYLVMTRLGRPISTVAAKRQTHEKQQRFMSEALGRAAKKHGLFRIDPADALCMGETCTVEADGKLLYFDDDHLNTAGSLFLFPHFEREIDTWLSRAGLPVGQKRASGVPSQN